MGSTRTRAMSVQAIPTIDAPNLPVRKRSRGRTTFSTRSRGGNTRLMSLTSAGRLIIRRMSAFGSQTSRRPKTIWGATRRSGSANTIETPGGSGSRTGNVRTKRTGPGPSALSIRSNMSPRLSSALFMRRNGARIEARECDEGARRCWHHTVTPRSRWGPQSWVKNALSGQWCRAARAEQPPN